MKILLIDNNTKHLDSISSALAGHELEVQKYQPGIDFNDIGKDMVVLSGGGGEGLEISDRATRHKLWYQDEMNFVRTTTKPVFGICMGFEIIVKAYSGKVHYRPELTLGMRTSHTTSTGEKLLKQKAISQLEAHYWYVPEVPDRELEVLGRSDSGIEIIRHKDKKIMGTQFHPEEGGSLSSNDFIRQLSPQSV